MWIDARHEQYTPGNKRQISYIIEGIERDDIKQKIWHAIGLNVAQIEIIQGDPNKVLVTYHENYISPKFMDYLLRQNGLQFTREGGG